MFFSQLCIRSNVEWNQIFLRKYLKYLRIFLGNIQMYDNVLFSRILYSEIHWGVMRMEAVKVPQCPKYKYRQRSCINLRGTLLQIRALSYPETSLVESSSIHFFPKEISHNFGFLYTDLWRIISGFTACTFWKKISYFVSNEPYVRFGLKVGSRQCNQVENLQTMKKYFSISSSRLFQSLPQMNAWTNKSGRDWHQLKVKLR